MIEAYLQIKTHSVVTLLNNILNDYISIIILKIYYHIYFLDKLNLEEITTLKFYLIVIMIEL